LKYVTYALTVYVDYCIFICLFMLYSAVPFVCVVLCVLSHCICSYCS